MSDRQSRSKRREARIGLCFLAPSLAGSLLFMAAPFVDAFRRSFSDAFGERFVGIQNYVQALHNPSFLSAIVNTVTFIACCVPLLIVLSLAVALILAKPVIGRAFLRTAFLLPMAIPVASMALLWQLLLHSNGLVNNLVEMVWGMRIDWMRTDASMFALVIGYLWRNMGYTMVLFIAALGGIPPRLYEAAMMDGASGARRFFSITLPCLRPALFTIAILSLLNALKAYREVYLVAGNYPHRRIYLLQHILNNWLRNLEMETLTAAAIVTALCFSILVAMLYRAWRTHEEGEGL